MEKGEQWKKGMAREKHHEVVEEVTERGGKY